MEPKRLSCLEIGNSPTHRSIFLQKVLGLSRDPFILSVAEQELIASVYGRSQEEKQPFIASVYGRPQEENLPFFEYFVPPPIPLPPGQTVLEALRESGPVLIFGERGSGKTMLRLALEAYIRSFPYDTLVVSHPLHSEDPLALVRDLAIDLFIQITEQGRLEPSRDPERLDLLLQALQPAGYAIARVIHRMQEEPPPEAPMGDALHWPALGRPAVRPLVLTQAHREFLLNRLFVPLYLAAVEGPTDPEIGFEAARRWGFRRVLILIDDADFGGRSEDAIRTRLSPLIENMPRWHQHAVDLIFFLPTALQPWIAPRIPVRPFLEAKLEWDDESLRRLLIHRFRASGSRRVGLKDLAGPSWQGDLDRILVRAARGSPRRLIQIIDRLIQVHVARDPDSPFFEREDWEQMRAEWPYEPPPPPSLEALVSGAG